MRKQLLAIMRERIYKPLRREELLVEMGLDAAQEEALQGLLAEMEQEGAVIRTRYGRYGLPEKMNLAVGRLQKNARGFAFLLMPKGEEDLYLAASNLRGAMHGDLVVARLLPLRGGRSNEGEVIRILKRANERIVGRFEGDELFGFCRPDDSRIGHDIVIPQGAGGGAKLGDRIVVRVVQFPTKRRQTITAAVEEVLGRDGDPGVDVLAVIRQYDLPSEFPQEVLQEAESIPQVVGEADRKGRLDLRHLPIVTIDGADAKDLDDAIFVSRLPNGNYELGVHIADVSHYVPANSPLDREAYARGTSIYLLDRVLPMLPPQLSNGICSLTPGGDRLTLSVIIEIDPQGRVIKQEIVESLIRSHQRLTYDLVNTLLLEQDPELSRLHADLLPHLRLMRELHDILLVKRQERGAIDFDVQEAQVILDGEGRVQDIIPREKTLADSIIEEFMVLANQVVAEAYYWLELPFVYRLHEEPKPERLRELNGFLGAFGLRLKIGSDTVHPKTVQTVLEQAQGRPAEKLIQRVLLRSMMRARYSHECKGHFGLALKYYCHFTAPIRRYPDLAIHRLIKENMRKRYLNSDRKEMLAAFMERAAVAASAREQLATEAERMVVDIKKTEFMLDKEGEIYEAIISGVANFGFFAELDNTVEGLVHVSSLDDDYYQYDDTAYALIGRHNKRRFRLGDRVRIRVKRVDLDERRIDFELADS